MLALRPADERGVGDHGWLLSKHTFSFADYYDPKHMGFRNLRVINEDRVLGGHGFGAHPHRDMEIVSYVLEGALRHRDSLGTGAVIRPGDVQRMTAGTGVIHSEYNDSAELPVHFLQIWLLPSARGLTPGYEQKSFEPAHKAGRLLLVASPTGADGSITLHSDAQLYVGAFDAGQAASLALAPERHAWVQVVRGHVRVNGQALEAGDGLALSKQPELSVEGVNGGGEALVFDLA